MIKTEDIVEAINIDLKECRNLLGLQVKGHFILLRNIETDSSFKAYKTYSIKLWYFKTKTKMDIVLEDKVTEKVFNNDDSKITRLLNISFLSKFLNFHNSDKWLNIVNDGVSSIK